MYNFYFSSAGHPHPPQQNVHYKDDANSKLYLILVNLFADVILNDAENENSDPYKLFSSPKAPEEKKQKTYGKVQNVKAQLANAEYGKK